MKKSIPIIRERESEAFILGNGREREFPLTPGLERRKKKMIKMKKKKQIHGAIITSCIIKVQDQVRKDKASLDNRY